MRICRILSRDQSGKRDGKLATVASERAKCRLKRAQGRPLTDPPFIEIAHKQSGTSILRLSG